MKSFKNLGLPEKLMQSLKKMQFTKPTPIQAETIPLALDGKDIIGSAQTGTGKTGAFSIPIIAQLIDNQDSTALIMTPTRELAVQVLSNIEQLIDRERSIKTALLIGGSSMERQLQQLRQRPRVVVGTPGRISDHIRRGKLYLKKCKFLVLDETDRMLDMGFASQIEDIIKHLPRERQTLLFSATMPKKIVKVAETYLRDPIRVSVGSIFSPIEAIKQENIKVQSDNKYQTLLDQVTERAGSIIVFVKMKHHADRIAKQLSRDGIKAAAIHGDLSQSRRERVTREFRKKKSRILVATDIAARGLDIPHIEHVINYDLPQCPEDYIHRIGRTARAGAEGSALCLITPGDKKLWLSIEKFLSSGEIDAEPSKKSFRRGNKRARPRQNRSSNKYKRYKSSAKNKKTS